MLSAFTESNRLFGVACSSVYNAITPSMGGGAALVATPPGRFLFLVPMHGRHVVERAAVPLHVLDHQVMLTAHQVLRADLLAGLKRSAQNVLDPLAGLSLRPKVGGCVRVNLASGVRSF